MVMSFLTSIAAESSRVGITCISPVTYSGRTAGQREQSFRVDLLGAVAAKNFAALRRRQQHMEVPQPLRNPADNRSGVTDTT